MSFSRFLFAVRLIGFSKRETAMFAAVFAAEASKERGYFHLADHDLRDPDLYIVNTEDLQFPAILSNELRNATCPVLQVGSGETVCWDSVHDMLDELMEMRADVLPESAELARSAQNSKNRLSISAQAAQIELACKRDAMLGDVGILIVDKDPAFQTYLEPLLRRSDAFTVWAVDEKRAIDLCRQQNIAVAMINTSMPEVDPYRLCKAIKQEAGAQKTAVIFLISPPFVYHRSFAKEVGVEGFLNQPLADHHLLSVLDRFLPTLT
jgi:CheY-like chemotaxis protein